ncbi:unnamed protein product [Rhizoctonia solani]|uniref:HAT C-terminal dimerisation domain-containing protein n=2 Tax=Rhizoctonia solani TaxID=456999 RepID=A0A8H3DCW5_9AGAM|nr:unnamed protein product [Rhizoctonia solani]
MSFATEKYGIEWIGWCTDAGGDAKKARRLAFIAFPWLICPDCWAHQINLIVGDYFKLRLQFMDSTNKAQIIIKWFNNHSRALGLLRQEQHHTLGKTLALIMAIATRWTSHYHSLRRLLDCIRPLRAIAVSQRDTLLLAGGKAPKAREAASEVLDILNSDQFWMDIARTVLHLAPLAIASHITQAASTRLDHVLLTLAHMYHVYSTMTPTETEICKAICTLIEKRWSACDQDICILAVFLNPFIRADLFPKSNIDFNPASIFTLVLRVWARLFQQPLESAPSGLRRATIDYYGRKEEFSDDRMHLKLAADEAREKGQDIDVVDIWGQLDTGSFESGRNWLVKLAIRILSVVANSAGCERLFSTMGLIHTKTRNRLDLERVRKLVYLRGALQREQALLGWSRSRLKRRIDTEEPDVDNFVPGVEVCEVEEDISLEAGVKRLIDEANADVDDEPDAIGALFGRPARIPLSELFTFLSPGNLTSSSKAGSARMYIDQLWRGAIISTDDELELVGILEEELNPPGPEVD